MEDARVLWDLQRVDEEVARLTARLEGLASSGEITRLREEVAQGRAGLAARRQRDAAVRRELRRQQDEVDSLEAAITQTEGRLYGGQVQSTRELEQLRIKLEQQRKELGQREERLLAVMEEGEELEAAVAAGEEALRAAEERLAALEQELEAERAAAEAQLKKVQARREEAAARVAPAWLAEYTRAKERRGRAVALVEGDRCTGCRVELPTALRARLREARGLVRCDRCGRILYLPAPSA